MSVRTARIGDILKLQRDPIDVVPGSSYRRIGIYSWGRGIIHHPPVDGSEMGSLRYFTFPSEALVLSNIQVWEAAVAVTTEDEGNRFVCSNRFLPYVPIRPDVADVRYLQHYFVSDPGLDALRRASPGTQVRNRTLGKALFEAIEVPLPRIDEQRRIATHLDGVARRATDVAARVQSQDQALPSAILPQLIARRIGVEQLADVAVSDLLRSINDTVHPGDDARGADVFIGLEHVEPHTGRLLSSRPVMQETGRKLRFEQGDVTYGYLPPYLNKVWVAERVGLCSAEQFVLRSCDSVDPHLLAHVLRSATVLERAMAATNSLQLPRLRLATLMNFTVPDIRHASDELLYDLDSLRDRFVRLAALRARRAAAVGSLLPAARNEVFSSLR